RGELTGFEDELLGLGEELEGLSPLVAAEIERPRTGPMRDIVASIQPEQDEIVRAGIDRSVCVQGGPGTGKTAVGLHRAAYLLYAHAGQLRRSAVLVVGPNDAGRTAFRNLIVDRLLQITEQRVHNVTRGDVVAALRESKAAHDIATVAWPKIDPVDVVFGLLSDPDAMAAAAGGVLSDQE